jgi:putative efflux protein, MATE family
MNKAILKLAIPNIISNITIPLLGMVDMILMGHLDSVAYIGAIGLGGTIFSVLYSIFSFMRAGTTGFTAQAFGAGNKTEVSYSLYRSLSIAVLAALLVISLQKLVILLGMKLLNGSSEVLLYTAEYFHVRIWAAPAVLCLYALNGWCIGLQNTAIPMTIAIITNIVNIVTSIFFVNVMNMDVSGVALGTVIAQYFGLFLAMFFLFKKFRQYLVPINGKILFQVTKLERFFKVNADFMIRSVLLVLCIAFFTNQSAKLGDNMLATNMILLQFFYIFSYFTDGFAYAGEALVGKFTGAGDLSNLKKVVKYLFLWGLCLSFPFTLAYWAFPESFIRMISDNAELISSSMPYHVYMILIPLITFAAFIWDGVYIGATASKAIRNTMIIATFLVFLPSWYWLMPRFDNHGLWIAFLLFMIARGVAMSIMAKKSIFHPLINKIIVR